MFNKRKTEILTPYSMLLVFSFPKWDQSFVGDLPLPGPREGDPALLTICLSSLHKRDSSQ